MTRKCNSPKCDEYPVTRLVQGIAGTAPIEVYQCPKCDRRRCSFEVNDTRTGCGAYIPDPYAKKCPSCGVDL